MLKINKRYVIEVLFLKEVFYFRDDLNKFMESIGVIKGIMILIINLYKFFIRLDKYFSFLKELERYIEVGR